MKRKEFFSNFRFVDKRIIIPLPRFKNAYETILFAYLKDSNSKERQDWKYLYGRITFDLTIIKDLEHVISLELTSIEADLWQELKKEFSNINKVRSAMPLLLEDEPKQVTLLRALKGELG